LHVGGDRLEIFVGSESCRGRDLERLTDAGA